MGTDFRTAPPAPAADFGQDFRSARSEFRSKSGDDFWERSGGAAIDFLNFADFDDWITTLKAVAQLIADQRPSAIEPDIHHTPLLMDYGCGFAHSLRDLINILLWKHSLPTRWYAYDIDTEIVDLLSKKLWSPTARNVQFPGIIKYTSCLKEIYSEAPNCLDCILFMHSIYFVDNASSCIEYCFEKLLKEDGFILLLTVAEDSPFYVLDEFLPDNGTYLLSKFYKIDRKVSRTMRFSIPKQFLTDDVFIAQMFQLMSRGRAPLSLIDQFRLRFCERFSEHVNMRDEIIMLRR
jgi:SAM-dependent methyltransferase